MSLPDSSLLRQNYRGTERGRFEVIFGGHEGKLKNNALL
jgi:hypothetical protein